MKIRSGFVANSSSSSFVFPVGDKFHNITELAVEVIKSRHYYPGSSYFEGYEKDEDVALIQKLAESKYDPDMNIAFDYPGYTAYIAKVGNYFVVRASRHMSGEDISEFSCMVPDELLKELKIDKNKPEDVEYFGHATSQKYWFWFPDYDILGREYSDENDDYVLCAKHTTEMIELISGKIVCPICYSEKKRKRSLKYIWSLIKRFRGIKIQVILKKD